MLLSARDTCFLYQQQQQQLYAGNPLPLICALSNLTGVRLAAVLDTEELLQAQAQRHGHGNLQAAERAAASFSMVQVPA
jgi:hypothetical protein